MATVASDVARLVVRLGVGGILAFDGYQKVLTWYRGRQTPVAKIAGATAGSPVPEPADGTTTAGRTVSLTAGISEAVGGAMLILGVATPATGAAAASSMALTATADTSDRFGGGYEIPAVLGICAGALAIAGPGRISVDHVIGNRLSNRPAALALAVRHRGRHRRRSAAPVSLERVEAVGSFQFPTDFGVRRWW